MLFDSWTRLAQLVIATVVAYASLIAVLRVSGKRTLAKLNAFDFVVTIALGSVLATVVLSRSVALGVVLETDGTFSVISDAGDGSALTGLRPHDATTDRR